MATKCIPIAEEATQKQADEYIRIGKKWFDNPTIRALTGGGHTEFAAFRTIFR